MSKKTLMVLAVLAVVLAAALWKSGKTATRPTAGREGDRQPLLSGVDMGTLSRIEIQEGSSTTHLEKAEGGWCVAEQENAPADINRLRDMMRSLDEMKRGQVAEAGDAHLAEYGLADGGDAAPLKITLKHGNGTTVLSLGKMRESQRNDNYWGPPGGRYARVDGGPVLLLKEDVRMAQAGSDLWWDRSLIALEPESIRKMAVQAEAESYVLERQTNGVVSLAGLGDGESTHMEAANRLLGALRSLRAEKRMPAATEWGDAFANAATVQADVEGATYRIQLGKASPDKGEGRPIRIEIEVASGATPEQQAVAAAAAKKSSGRTFLIPVYQADSLTLKRSDLIQQSPEPAPVETPEPPPVPSVE